LLDFLCELYYDARIQEHQLQQVVNLVLQIDTKIHPPTEN